MEKSGKLLRKVSVELCTVVMVRKRCQFCYAFYKDANKIAKHSERCEFRFSETFEAFDGKVKFACAVNIIKSVADEIFHSIQMSFAGLFRCFRNKS